MRLSQQLVADVLRPSMIWEVLSVFAFNYQVKVFEVVEAALSQELQFRRPDYGDAHVLPGVGDDCTSQ